MKKVLYILLILFVIFAFASCKQEPKQNQNEEKPLEPDPDEDAPITQPGVLDVRPSSDVEEWSSSNWEQNGKFQFKLDVEFNANESIDLYLKCSNAFEKVAIRQAGGKNTKFLIGGKDYVPLADLQKDENGWYIVSVPASSVTPQDSGGNALESWTSLGITLYVPDPDISGKSAWEYPCYVAIKGLALNGEFFDVAEWENTETSVSSFYSSPNALDVVLTLDE